MSGDRFDESRTDRRHAALRPLGDRRRELNDCDTDLQQERRRLTVLASATRRIE